MTTRDSTRRSTLLVSLLAGLLILASCSSSGSKAAPPVSSASTVRPASPGGQTGVTASTITISVDGAFSGAYAAFYNEDVWRTAAQTWAAEVNANGGINGRMVVLKKVDDKYTVEGAVGACKEIESNGSFAAFTPSLFPEGLDCLDKAGIPAQANDIFVDPAQVHWTHVHTISTTTTDGASSARYVGGANGIVKPGSKVGVVYTADGPSFSSFASGFKDQAAKLGLTVVEEKLTTGQASFTAEVRRLKDAGVQTVVMTASTEALGVLRDANAISFAPKWSAELGFDADEYSVAVGTALLQGMAGRRPWATTDTPAWTQYLGAVNKYAPPGKPPTTTGMVSYDVLKIMQHALQLAGTNLTRESFLAAYNQITNFDTGGVPPVTFSGGQIFGATTSFTIVCCQPDKTWKGTGPAN
jgi:ABC-type branched-subunit amino acid transport system substrate-binding protein